MFMDSQELWEKFTRDGKIDGYLEYRRHLEMQAESELKLCDENQRPGACDKRTECGGV